MSKSNSVRCYDYVNHPYDTVRTLLAEHADIVFRNATKTAASRVHTVASELHVNVGGIDLGTDISIAVKKIEHVEKKPHTSAMTNIDLEWVASKMPQLFPVMKAQLSIYPLTSTETQLDLQGRYEVPLGFIGSAINIALGHRIAEASVLHFIKDVAVYLRTELSSAQGHKTGSPI